MNDENYFIPEASDLHIGYECEIKMFDGHWEPYILQEDSFFGIGNVLRLGELRTSFLTKEQLTKEGCLTGLGENYDFFFKSGHTIYPFFYINNENVISGIIIEYNGNMKFNGVCKDVNTFRKICRIVGV